MRSLVTGSSGLLGDCLVTRLEARGDTLRLIDMVPPDRWAAHHGASHEFVEADIAQPEALRPAARGVDVIYHLAAAQRMKPQFQWSEERIYESNLAAVRNVLAAAEAESVSKVVFVSSSGVYGLPQGVPVTEAHPIQPLGSYGDSKIEAEALCAAAVERGIDVSVLRPMSLFGPRMTGVFVILFEWVRTGRPVFLLGNGRNRVQGASAWDVADACIAAALSERSKGAVVNIGADPASVPSVAEWVRALIEHAGTGSPVVPIPSFALRNAARALHWFGQSPIVPEHYILADSNFVLDISAARERLGWEPKVDNVGLLNEAYDWYVGAGEAFRPRFHPLVRAINAIMPRSRAGPR